MIVIATSYHGVGVSPDSVGYLSAARSHAAGKGFTLFSGELMTVWPPLFPFVLSLAERFGIGAIPGGRFLHALAFGTIVLLCGKLFLRIVQSRSVAWVGIGALVLGVPLIDSMVMLWSEPIFALLVVCTVLVLERYMRDSKLSTLLALAILLALASLQRYSGLGLTAAVLPVIALAPERIPSKARVCRAFAAGVLAILPILSWMIRNYYGDGTILGPRSVRDWVLLDNLSSILSFLSTWLLPSVIPTAPRIMLAVLMAMVFAAAIARLGGWKRLRLRATGPFLLAVTWTAVSYSLFLIVSTAGVKVDPVNSRMLSPIFPLVILVVLVLVDSLVASIQRHAVIRKVLLVTGVCWLLYPSVWIVSRLTRWKEDGIGYASRQYSESQLLSWLIDHPLTSPLMSNDPEAVYYVAGITAHRLPAHERDNVTDFQYVMASEQTFVVWFNDYLSKDCYNPSELKSLFTCTDFRKFEDGSIYKMSGTIHYN